MFKKREMREIRGCLSHLATPDQAAVRRHDPTNDEDLLGYRPFAVDAQNKLFAAKALRRAADKTQVITHPDTCHIRTRLTHTLEVASVACQIGGILGLNVGLCEAIAFGHDIGHTPFGHIGEVFLTGATGKKFRHEIFGVVLAQKIERRGAGLNLTKQVLTGILHHSTGINMPLAIEGIPPEANVALFADKIAYLTGDFNDIVVRYGHQASELLNKTMEVIGANQRERINYFISALCRESAEQGKVCFSAGEEYANLQTIKREMVKMYPEMNYRDHKQILEKVYEFLLWHGQQAGYDPAIGLALMTDKDVLYLNIFGRKIIGRKGGFVANHLRATSLWELIPTISSKKIDFTKPDLDWKKSYPDME